MNHLLVADTFDPFLLEEATISTALTVTIDGHINKTSILLTNEAKTVFPGNCSLLAK